MSNDSTPRGNHFENQERLTSLLLRSFTPPSPSLQCQTILTDFGCLCLSASAAQNSTPPFFHTFKRSFLACWLEACRSENKACCQPFYTCTLLTVEWRKRWSQWMKLFSSGDEVDHQWYREAEGDGIDQIRNTYHKENLQLEIQYMKSEIISNWSSCSEFMDWWICIIDNWGG